MKKLIVALAVAGMIGFSGSADAQTATQEVAPVVTPTPIVENAPVYNTRRNVRSVRRGGVFSNLIELERRKNAWLRRTFLNRR